MHGWENMASRHVLQVLYIIGKIGNIGIIHFIGLGRGGEKLGVVWGE